MQNWEKIFFFFFFFFGGGGGCYIYLYPVLYNICFIFYPLKSQNTCFVFQTLTELACVKKKKFDIVPPLG